MDPLGLKVQNCGVVPIIVKPEEGPPGILPPGHTWPGNPDGVFVFPGGGWTKTNGSCRDVFA